jgi:hypothetical protein
VPLFGKLLAEPPPLRRFLADIHHETQAFGGKETRDAVACIWRRSHATAV